MLVILLIIILVGILILPKFFKDEPLDQTPVVEVQSKEEENKITLSNIISNSTNNAFYNTLTSVYTVNVLEENNSIVFHFIESKWIRSKNKMLIK